VESWGARQGLIGQEYPAKSGQGSDGLKREENGWHMALPTENGDYHVITLRKYGINNANYYIIKSIC
jgi:hypothetical protein